MIPVEQGSWTGTRIGAHNGVRLTATEGTAPSLS